MMKRLRLWIRNVFGFSRAETNAFLILLPLMLLVLFSLPIYQLLIPKVPLAFDENQAKIDSLLAVWDFNPEAKNDSHSLFDFNPNTASQAVFDSLGFPAYLSKRIINYRSKGGRFKKPDDLLKIYGMDTALYNVISSFISIPPIIESKKAPKENKSIEKQQIETPLSFNLNLADTAELKTFRGIGPVLAERIVKYRNALGGFWDVRQLKEVYGLDSVVAQLLINSSFVDPGFIPKQIDINKATERDLSNHPYIRSKLARTIITYRFQHGRFSEIDELLRIEVIDQKILSNIRPYLKVGL